MPLFLNGAFGEIEPWLVLKMTACTNAWVGWNNYHLIHYIISNSFFVGSEDASPYNDPLGNGVQQNLLQSSCSASCGSSSWKPPSSWFLGSHHRGKTRASCRNRASVSVGMAGVVSVHPIHLTLTLLPVFWLFNPVGSCPHRSASATMGFHSLHQFDEIHSETGFPQSILMI